MARTLYRIYLYFVCVVMLGFVSASLGSLLGTVLLETPLRGQYETAPSSTSVVQNVVLAVVALVVSLGFGGLHYWLIQRDIAQDADAARGGVRTLALNFVQAGGALVALYAGASALGRVGQQTSGGLAAGVAATVIGLGLFGLAQVERNRAQPLPGAPMVFQRLHIYGVQVIILLSGIVSWSSAVSSTVQAVLVGLNLVPSPCAQAPGSPLGKVPGGPIAPVGCDLVSPLLGDWLSVLWMVGAWTLYWLLARGDTRSVLRQVAHFFGYVVGLVSAVVGIERVAELLLRAANGATTSIPADLVNQYNFFPALTFGLLVMFGYGLWLAREAEQTRMGRQGVELTQLALTSIVLLFPFYIGIADLLRGVVEVLVPNGSPLGASEWAAAGALTIAGLAHAPLSYLVRLRTTADAPVGPRRGLVLAGLAVGALAAAIAVAVAIYLVVTAQLGTQVGPDWGVQARTAGVVVVVGAFVAGVHLWRMLDERKLLVLRPPSAPSATSPAAPTQDHAIEGVLDELLAGRITREQAADQLRGIVHPQA